MPNGIKEEYNYDDMGRLTQIAYGTTGRTISYSYDYAGNVLSMTDWTGTTTYSYDNIYQLTQATYPNTGTQNFTYDQAGNRIADNTKTYYYNNLNQLLYTSDGTNYSYDANGNLISKTKNNQTTTYTWNEFDRLVEVNLPDGKKIKFVYGADGLRREKIGEERLNYLLDGLIVLCEFDDSLNLLREFVPGVSVYIGSESFYYHYDRLGSVCFISDSGGSVVCDYVYDAFGNLLSSSGSLNQPYEYVGREGYYREAVFNLYLLGQRWYDSEAGRFISRDPIPIFNITFSNVYVYSKNNSLNYLDPSGLWCVIIGEQTTSWTDIGHPYDFKYYSEYLPNVITCILLEILVGIPCEPGTIGVRDRIYMKQKQKKDRRYHYLCIERCPFKIYDYWSDWETIYRIILRQLTRYIFLPYANQPITTDWFQEDLWEVEE